MSGKSLERVAYRSRALRPDLALFTLAEIIAVSDRNNRRDGLTGALLVSAGRFFQVLEGAIVDVDRTLARIADDPRHADIEIVLREPAVNRFFEGWSMVAARVAPSATAEIDAAINRSETEPQTAMRAVVDLVKHQHGQG